MDYGLRTWDVQGRPEIEVTSRILKILGTADTGKKDGSLTDGRLSGGRPFYLCAVTGTLPVQVWFSGITMYWKYRSDWNGYTTAGKPGSTDIILYGVY
ncbi:hypothetical protein VRQ87_000807 [Morganella morganii]|nr:hypothetical protein [Morganella morganii]